MNSRFLKFAAAAGVAAGTLMAANATLAASVQSQQQIQTKTIYVMADEQGLPGSDGQNHDAFMPSNFVLKAGVPVKLVFVNTDDMVHTFTNKALGINVIIAPATDVAGSDKTKPATTTYTFTPTAKGEFRWHCNGPCDPWSMKASFDGTERDGYMAGYVEVI